jgi:hypothetical protein
MVWDARVISYIGPLRRVRSFREGMSDASSLSGLPVRRDPMSRSRTAVAAGGRPPRSRRAPGPSLRRKTTLVCAVVAALLVSVSGPLAPAASAVVPGCDSAHPTRIGGGLYGYPDNRALNALIGVDAKNANGQRVNRDGTVISTAGYSWVVHVNPELPPQGSTDPGARRDWNDPVLQCASANVRQVFLEVYPRRPPNGSVTDFTRFGGAAHYRQPITPNADNQILLRLPVRDEQGGNTGYVNGYITANGGPVANPTTNLRIRAFPTASGPECGVEGFAASAEQLATSGSGTATFYRTPPLAGGRCNAATQEYSLQVTWLQPNPDQMQCRHVNIADGRGVRVDFVFPSTRCP